MELVFFYINQTPSKFIEKKGFNFSANYNFYVEYTDGTYVLKQKKCKNQLPSHFFDEQGCITNITAIVGENGAGKTTLLTMLSNYFGGIRDNVHVPAYLNYYEKVYVKEKILAIYLEKSELVCYHNLDAFENDVGIKEHCLHQGSVGLADIIKNRSFKDISRICISNSMYALENEVSIYGSISKISLNPKALSLLKNGFYEKKCRNKTVYAGDYDEIQEMVCRKKKLINFSKFWICYICSLFMRRI